MNLLQIRKKLVELSGLVDLVEDYYGEDYSDNGADFFIQEGQKWLDQKLETPKSGGTFTVDVKAGQYNISASDIRGVKRLKVITDSGISYLDKISISEMTRKFTSDNGFSGVERGEPTHYAIGIDRNIQSKGSQADAEYKSILIMPPPDTSYQVVVEGLYFSHKLDNDKDICWWSINRPAILIQAALYMHESFLRNSSGLNDWRNTILDAVQGIDFDVVEEESAEIDQMDDAWNFRDNQPTIYRGRARRT